jgi:hypothetical protein
MHLLTVALGVALGVALKAIPNFCRRNLNFNTLSTHSQFCIYRLSLYTNPLILPCLAYHHILHVLAQSAAINHASDHHIEKELSTWNTSHTTAWTLTTRVRMSPYEK